MHPYVVDAVFRHLVVGGNIGGNAAFGREGSGFSHYLRVRLVGGLAEGELYDVVAVGIAIVGDGGGKLHRTLAHVDTRCEGPFL